MKHTHRVRIVLPIAVLVVAIGLVAQEPRKPDGPANRILARELALEQGDAQVALQSSGLKSGPGVSGGVMSALRDALNTNADDVFGIAALFGGGNGNDDPPTVPRVGSSNGCPNVFEGDNGTPDNIRVNQDCSLRRQAEEVVVVNPTDYRNLIAGQNDSRAGFNLCGYDWSLNRGRRWGDTGTAPPPFYQELLADGATADACSDPSATFDHLGNAFVTGVFFDINFPASAIFVAKSNAPFKGLFYHTPRPLSFQEYRTTPMGRPASDNDPDIFHDKELMIADSRSTSPKKGRVYVTWTRFDPSAKPHRLQPVARWRGNLVAPGHHQRRVGRVLHHRQRHTGQPERLRPGPGLAPGRRARRDDLRDFRQRQHALEPASTRC